MTGRMRAVSEPSRLSSREIGGRRPFRALWHWYRPYVTGSRGRLAAGLAFAAVTLACQAVVPLQVESILHHEHWDTAALALLAILIVVEIGSGFLTDISAHEVAYRSAERLRLAIFAQTLRSRVLRQEGLVRSSIVSRHTSDVDHVSEAAEVTLAQGLPAVVRVIQSLILLAVIEWRAGLVMTIAALAFVLFRAVVGRGLLVMDQRRLSASSRVGETVDEAISASRQIAGLHLNEWVDRRFRRRAEDLTHATHGQSIKIAQLITSAHATGLLGLLAVVVFAVAAGGPSLAAVAAAILYVEAVVTGLATLPGWVRSLQLAVVSRYRIDQILKAPTESDSDEGVLHVRGPVIAEVRSFDPPAGTLVGLVTPPGLESDAVLTTLSAGSHPDPWRVTLQGQTVRMPEVCPEILHVPHEVAAFNASVSDHLRALAPDLDEQEERDLLEAVGLQHLAELPGGLDTPLGPTGGSLTLDERQRLMLGSALAAHPRILLIGPLTALADTDTALPLVAALRRYRTSAVVMAVSSPEVAAAMDSMVFATRDTFRHESHDQLLIDSPEYERLWGRRILGEEVDLSVLGLGDAAEDSLYARLVTERYSPGEIVYRQGALADRVVFVISGHVEIVVEDSDGSTHRVAVLGPGNHCGDLRLTVGERRAETVRALDSCVVRSLTREAISAGLTGLLDRTPAERRVVASLLRSGPATRSDLAERLPDVSADDLSRSLALLEQDGAVRTSDGLIHPVIVRTAKSGARDILDRLGDL